MIEFLERWYWQFQLSRRPAFTVAPQSSTLEVFFLNLTFSFVNFSKYFQFSSAKCVRVYFKFQTQSTSQNIVLGPSVLMSAFLTGSLSDGKKIFVCGLFLLSVFLWRRRQLQWQFKEEKVVGSRTEERPGPRLAQDSKVSEGLKWHTNTSRERNNGWAQWLPSFT